MAMRIVVVGGGGREHAITWALARHGHEVVCAPGNPGIAGVAECVAVGAEDVPALVELIGKRRPDLVVVGPEAPLVAGLADAVRALGIPCFGPGTDGAQLEGSKAFTKQLLVDAGVPTAAFRVCTNMAEVDIALTTLGGNVVVKADGLAAGKGVVVCDGAGQARAAAATMLEEGRFGEAGRRVVIERKLRGREASVLAIADGQRLVVLPGAEDHKAVLDGDRGPNTGGMGVVSPTPTMPPELLERVEREVLGPTLAALRARGIDYRGVLYAGIMVDADDGTPWTLEYNCRFGDPEAEPLFVRWQDDPAPWLHGAATGQLPPGAPSFGTGAAVCVIMASHGYPDAPRKGDAITGVEDAESLGDVVVFHAGTKRDGDRLVTSGGRVLAVTASGADVSAARARAYQAVERIRFDGAHYRRDIGARKT
jgi:phosphoribosylamine--glycine ligase